jgi:hypothetical protein
MKIIILLLVTVFATSLNLKSQDFNYNDGQVGTTMEIYNYVTKGFSVQISSGLDMKKGYFLWNKFSRSTKSADGQRSVEVNALIQESNFKVCAWMLIYQESGSIPIYFCIPTQASDDKVWNKSFEDLRDSKLSPNAYLTYSWALYNLIGQLSNDYQNICFTASTLITMADGTEKLIKDIQKGDMILSYDLPSSKPVTSKVSELIIHKNNSYEITRITLNNEKMILASSKNSYTNNFFFLEATSNHPVLTSNGVKTIGELTTSDRLWYYDFSLNKFFDLPIIETKLNFKKVTDVYNVILENNDNYIANKMVVLMK